MAERSRRRKFVRVALIVAGLFLLLLIAVPLLVPAERWQQIAFDRLQAETGLVASASSASVSIFPLGLKLEGLKVHDPENRPEWSGLELDLDEALVRARLKPLFSGRFEADQVKLVRPKVVLAPPAAVPEDSLAAGAGGDAPAPAVSLALASIAVEDGRIEIRQPDGSRVVLSGLDNESSLHLEGGRGRATAKGSMDSLLLAPVDAPEETVRALAWDADAEFAADGSSGTARFAALEIPGARLEGSAEWTQDKRVRLDASLEADFTALSKEWFEPRRGELPWPEGVDPRDFGDFRGSFEGRISGDVVLIPDATPVELASEIRVEGRVEEAGGRVLGRDDLFTLSGAVAFVSGELAVAPLEIATPPGNFSGSYTARPLEKGDARLELQGSLESARARELAAALWPKLLPLMEGEATGPEEWPQVAGPVDLQLTARIPAEPDAEPEIEWSARAAKLTVRPVDVDADFEVAAARLSGDAKSATVHEGRVTGPGLDLTPRVNVQLSEEGTRVSGKITSQRIDLDTLQERLAPKVETASGNWFVGEARAAGEEMWVPPAELSAELDLSADEVLASGHRLTGVSGRVNLAAQQVAVRSMQASLGSGTVTGVADVDYREDPPRWSTQLAAKEVPASVLLAADAPKLAEAVQTAFSGEFQFQGGLLTDPQAAMKQLSGEVDLVAAAGMVQTEPVLGNTISQFVGNWAPKWKELAFQALDANLRVEDGSVHFDRLLLTGNTEVRAGGLVTLDGRCDYRLDIVLPPEATPQVGALQPVVDLLREENGAFPFSVRVTGPARQPKVDVDVAALRERAEERGKDAAGETLQDTAKGLLDRLKGKN